MAKNALIEREQAAVQAEKKTPEPPAPYAPSWVDRLTDWVSALPIPAWLFYLLVALVLILLKSSVAWYDGSYAIGTFFPFHVVDSANGIYLLFVLQYLDKRAIGALASLRSALTVDDAEYKRLAYQLTTMPALPTFAWTLVGLLFGVFYPLLISDAQLDSLKLLTSSTAVGVDLALSALNWMINAIFAYHTVRQLRLVSRIYTRHTKVNVFDPGPLYALSRVTALTTIALLLITFLYFTVWVNWQFETAPDIAIAMGFVLIAVASFVWPLLGAHRLLREQKQERRGEIARRMEVVTNELHRRTDAGDFSEMTNINLALDSYIKEQGALEKISTWPWERDTVRLVVTVVVLPIGLWIITRILERLGF